MNSDLEDFGARESESLPNDYSHQHQAFGAQIESAQAHPDVTHLDVASAFSALSLSLFIDRPRQCTQLLRAQHAEILGGLSDIMSACEDHGKPDAAGLKLAFSRLGSNLITHLGLERSLVGKQMSADPRARAIFDQFEREIAPLSIRVSSLNRAFATPSLIASKLTEFKQAVADLRLFLEERFRSEERELFNEFDAIAHQG